MATAKSKFSALDELPITVSISDTVTQCQCCGKEKLKRTVCINHPELSPIYLGVICTGQWFSINMTGNAYYAAKKLENKFRTSSNEKIQDIIEKIQEAAGDWH